ncbi:hypothetical protein A2U01_0056251, partial [Trifolium medium]|nr:hypothetical protein [Trifolium medium]
GHGDRHDSDAAGIWAWRWYATNVFVFMMNTDELHRFLRERKRETVREE